MVNECKTKKAVHFYLNTIVENCDVTQKRDRDELVRVILTKCQQYKHTQHTYNE